VKLNKSFFRFLSFFSRKIQFLEQFRKTRFLIGRHLDSQIWTFMYRIFHEIYENPEIIFVNFLATEILLTEKYPQIVLQWGRKP